MDNQIKILIVDDIKANVALLEAMLDEFKFTILKAYGGKEAIDLAKKEHPNLMLLDIMMPDLDGFQVCNNLRQDTDFDSMPIIMVTAKDKDSDIVQSLEKGADDYISKPVIKEDLRKKVVDMLAKAKTGNLPSKLYLDKLRKQKEK